MKLTVNEIFYSLQGEGGRSGEASIFVRLTKCNLACSFCDTDFAEGDDMTLDEILEVLQTYPCKWIIWTGGEPTIQLRDEHLAFFRSHGYKQAIETNGTRPVSSLIDYITCSPKKNYESIRSRIPVADEIRMPIAVGDTVPDISIFPQAKNYFLSPIFDADKINLQNVAYCVELIKEHPQWRLSLQIHKLIHIE
ncbi:7-carboxy-7-deazaguanine synthase [Dysgonomonas sp. PFB1-18]|uniref:7-carboxy-7-deazaguanine synthase QueE n=1 Tax=unclassified Dysgonomonas TaxID=2630389 RepID=UPI00247726AD|nr:MULTISPECIES: 7-carboxy-7-deazaguanine synthase QueE [unclassified Dysgonomonas]MDH6307199.1 7-carboxy-7-deazaguanine synthase [Dysgonomonas sp. PF1-14]MDH6337118.1 7-carboxy-7-deazaguanine synthase [Dysgonomonas sp. PF1-16]MDH6381104.1 7-carboxy-7-deazaguanine synthase [Dysgonomonas sp. PFB1-18]MDH6396317.1 7-carboxy-7-deazaguanine synthase [Dysgonomonas sp. PF1-23]